MSAFHARHSAPLASGVSATVSGRIPANLRRWQAALAKLRAGSYRPKLVFIGDSKRYGMGAGTDSANTWSTAAEPRSMPAHVVRQLVARGVPASRQSTFGTGGVSSPAIKTAYDPRVTGLLNWSGGSPSLGGNFWATAGTDPFVFTSEGAVDTFDIYSKLRAGDGSMTATIDADATVVATIAGNNAGDGFKKTTIAVPRGVHALKLQRVSGGYASLAGIIAKDSSAPAVDIVNGGVPGTVSGYHVSTAGSWNSANIFAILAPDLVVIQLGSNDLNTSVPVGTYIANILDILLRARAAGADVVLEVATFGNAGGYGTDAEREAYRQELIALGAAQGCMVVDHAARFGPYASASAIGLMRDAIHETEAGYADEAAALVDALLF